MQAILGLSCIDRLRGSAAILFFLALPSLLILACPTPGETAGWSATGALATSRNVHTATLLGNGQVLVAGGYYRMSDTQYGELTSAELYNPATKTWSYPSHVASGALANRRGMHTATLLDNGQVLLVGGAVGSNPSTSLSSAELYDPATKTFSATGAIDTSRYGHTATLLGNGQVLVAGGWKAPSTSVFLSSAELYNPATKTWSATAALDTSRYGHTATLLGNGQVLVVGGWNDSGYWHTAELYDTVTKTWSATGAIDTGRAYHTATLLGNGQVLVAGGYNRPPDGGEGTFLTSAELYNPATKTWSATGPLTTSRAYHTATLLGNGQVLVAGGSNATNLTLKSAELFFRTNLVPVMMFLLGN